MTLANPSAEKLNIRTNHNNSANWWNKVQLFPNHEFS